MRIFNSDECMELIVSCDEPEVNFGSAPDPMDILIAREEFFAKCEELGIDPDDYL